MLIESYKLEYETMPLKPKTKRKKSKDKQHPLHAESLDRMTDDLKTLGCSNYPIYRDDIVRIFRNEAQRVRKILR